MAKPPPSPAPVPALRDLISTGSQVRHHLARTAGLTESELRALDLLSTQTRGPAELARLLEVSTPASTGIVDRLVTRGHAERRPHAGDRRRIELHLTESGRTELRSRLTPMIAALRDLDARFSEDELAVVERYLRGATEALRVVLSDGAEKPRAGSAPG
ncbi:MarR family transcriptional regulator [Nocardioides pantholopis]|uniref:MarR family transcriptional regulator n=1 Tax=Nocardioides pantholopis TaxID=2483798 RepID=UPI000F0753FE|nr:MarR family transcriptional regulator [Nocardioides pantholopis]